MRHGFFVALCLLLAQIALGDAGIDFHSNKYSYNLHFPSGWERIADGDLQGMRAHLLKPGSGIYYEAAFQRSGSALFDYPYVLIQIISYGESSQPSLAELKSGFLRPYQPHKEQSLTPEGQKLVDAVGAPNIQFNDAQASYVLKSTVQLSGEEPGQTYCIGFCGRHCIVQIGFNCPTKDFTSWQPSFDEIARSFKFAPAEAFDFSVEGSPNNWIWSGMGKAALSGVFMAFVGVIVRWFRRPARQVKQTVTQRPSAGHEGRGRNNPPPIPTPGQNEPMSQPQMEMVAAERVHAATVDHAASVENHDSIEDLAATVPFTQQRPPRQQGQVAPRFGQDTCANCGRTIGRLETPHVFKEQVVCFACKRILDEAENA